MTNAQADGVITLARSVGESPAAFLLDFLDVPAPSGFEHPAAVRWAQEAGQFAEVRADALGGQIALVNMGSDHCVAIHGHLDEIGLIVRSVDKFGLIKFGPIGGWWTAVLTGQRVVILTERGRLIGTVGQLAPHQLPLERRGKELKYEDLWIDIGATTKDEALSLVRPGDPVVLEATPHVFDNGRVISRSADNRLGCFIALEVARRSQGFAAEVAAVANGTEEIGGSGAQIASYDIAPSVACVVDVIPTSDVPGEHDEDVVIGKGPVITIGGFSSPVLARELIGVARDQQMDFQLNSAGSHTWTDADDIIRTGEGVPTVVVSVPTRYLHSPGEVFDIADVEATIQLLVAWVKQN